MKVKGSCENSNPPNEGFMGLALERFSHAYKRLLCRFLCCFECDDLSIDA